MKKMVECCANCKYWDCYEEEALKAGKFAKGECHRYPPSVWNFNECEKTHEEGVSVDSATMLLVMNTPLLSHPFTYDECWCGEFKAANVIHVFVEEDEDEDE